MESNFEHIKQSFNESPSSLPPELDWEQMEEGILQKMDALEAEEKKKKRPFIWFFWSRSGFALGLILLGIVAIFALYPGSPFRSPSEAGDQASLVQGDESQEGANISEERRANRFSEEGHNSPTEVMAGHPLPVEGVGSDGLAGASSENEVLPSIPQPALVSRDLQGADPGLTLPGIPQAIEPGSSAAGRSEEMEIDIPRIIGLSDSLHQNTSPVLLSAIEPQLPEANLAAIPGQSPRSGGRLIASAGTNFWNQGFWGEKPERNAYETSLISYQSQLSYLHPLTQKWGLSVGIQYQKLDSRFDRVYEIEDFEVLLADVIVKREYNLVTGRVRELRGDVTVTVPAQRSITHFNSTELYQAQVAISRTWTTGRLQADVLVGGSVNLFTQNQGRTQYQGELKFYEGAATDFLANQGKLNGLLSGRITYRLSQHWGIVSSLQVQQSLLNWSLEPNVRMYPTVIGMEIGLSYRL